MVGSRLIILAGCFVGLGDDSMRHECAFCDRSCHISVKPALQNRFDHSYKTGSSVEVTSDRLNLSCFLKENLWKRKLSGAGAMSSLPPCNCVTPARACLNWQEGFTQCQCANNALMKVTLWHSTNHRFLASSLAVLLAFIFIQRPSSMLSLLPSSKCHVVIIVLPLNAKVILANNYACMFVVNQWALIS